MSDVVIVRDGDTGEALIGRTNVAVAAVLQELASGPCAAAVLRAYPELSADDVAAAVRFAVASVRYEAPAPVTGVSMVREVAVAPAHQSRTILMEVDEYEALLDEVELLRSLCEAQLQVAAGDTVSSDEARAYFQSRFGG